MKLIPQVSFKIDQDIRADLIKDNKRSCEETNSSTSKLQSLQNEFKKFKSDIDMTSEIHDPKVILSKNK